MANVGQDAPHVIWQTANHRPRCGHVPLSALYQDTGSFTLVYGVRGQVRQAPMWRRSNNHVGDPRQSGGSEASRDGVFGKYNSLYNY